MLNFILPDFAPGSYAKKNGGAGGIRTHVPRTANGFRVRLVMTTSIPLRDNQSEMYYTTI